MQMLRRHPFLGSLNVVPQVSTLCHLNPDPKWHCSPKMETLDAEIPEQAVITHQHLTVNTHI